MSYKGKRRKADLLSGTEGVINSKFVDSNTLLIDYKDGTTAIRLHDTDVVTFMPGGTMILNSGGWRTSTTKDRINRFNPHVTIYQKDHIWYCHGAGQYDIVFYDGMIFGENGILKSSRIDDSEARRIRAMKRKIAKLVNKIDEVEELPVPGAGDCWFCSMIGSDGKSWGEHSGDIAHLIAHVDQCYLHGSLLVNALKHQGRKDRQIGFVWNMRDIQKRALRKYLYDYILFPKSTQPSGPRTMVAHFQKEPRQ